MLTVACPNCGAPVTFRSPALPSRVCDHCQTIVVRSGQNVEAVGKAAALPFDVSPIQIGTSGTFESHGFEVIGRVRWGWTDGSWNEWLLLFADGSHGWLGDAMGQFMLLRERPLGAIESRNLLAIASGKKAKPGQEAQIDGTKYYVGDAREVVLLAAEGELPFVPKPGWRLYSVDLRGRAGECATLQRDEKEASFYVGRYVRLSELAPRGLRKFDGWALPAYAN